MSTRKPRRKQAEDLSLVRPQNRNDKANAERFVRQHKGEVLYCEKHGWLFWGWASTETRCVLARDGTGQGNRATVTQRS